MFIQSLGPFALNGEGTSAAPSAPKQRQTLAMLAIHANRLVSAATLIQEIWGERAPRSSQATLQAYVARIRRFLSEQLGLPLTQIARSVLTTENSGYMLHWDAALLDHRRFESVAGLGRQALAAGRTEEAARLLGSALELWRDRALGNVRHGPLLEIQVHRLETLRLAVAEQRYDLDLQLGRHYEVLAELTELADQNPLNETVQGLLIKALVRTGKRSEALQTYEVMRARLAIEVGLGPSPQIAALQRRILSAAEFAPRTREVHSAATDHAVPCASAGQGQP